MTDRGSCFYHGATGHLVKAYEDAVGEQGFRSFAGDDGAWQPPDITDVLVHETVAAWVRESFRKRTFKKAETLEQNLVLFKDAASHVSRISRIPCFAHFFQLFY